jgi:hypothetical protein
MEKHRCEAFLGYGFGLPIVCGRKTELFDGTHWYCKNHPPKIGELNGVR